MDDDANELRFECATDRAVVLVISGAILLGLGLWFILDGLSGEGGLDAISVVGGLLFVVTLACTTPRNCEIIAARLIAGRDGVHLGGRRFYGWHEIAAFERRPAPRGNRERAFMLLRDGQEIRLKALRDEDPEFGFAHHPVSVQRGVTQLERMLERSRAA